MSYGKEEPRPTELEEMIIKAVGDNDACYARELIERIQKTNPHKSLLDILIAVRDLIESGELCIDGCVKVHLRKGRKEP